MAARAGRQGLSYPELFEAEHLQVCDVPTALARVTRSRWVFHLCWTDSYRDACADVEKQMLIQDQASFMKSRQRVFATMPETH